MYEVLLPVQYDLLFVKCLTSHAGQSECVKTGALWQTTKMVNLHSHFVLKAFVPQQMNDNVNSKCVPFLFFS